MDKIYAQLTVLLQDFFDDDSIIARSGLTADDVDGWDSLAHVRLLLTIGRAFKIDFSAAEITSFKNVGDLADAIAAKTNAG